MRRLVTGVVFMMALVAGVIGVAGVVLVDTDGVLRTPASQVDLSDAFGVRSTPGVLALTRATAVVEARGAAGVLVAAAHPVDVRAWLAGRPTRPVTEVGRSGVSVGPVSTMPGPLGGTPPSTDPIGPLGEAQALGLWDAAAAGQGWQRIDVPLNGSPTTYVIVPAQAGQSVEVRQGLLLPQVRPMAIGLLVGAVLLAGVGVWRVRGGRRRSAGLPPQTPEPGSEPRRMAELPTEPPSGTTQPPTTQPPTTESATTEFPTRRPTPRVVAPAVAVALGLSGCGAVPGQITAWNDATATKTALTSDHVPGVLASYDERNNAAIAAAAASGDPATWQQADTWALLEADTLSTRIRRESPPAAVTPGKHAGETAYAPGFGAYPMWALVPVTTRFGETEPRTSLALFTRATLDAPWLAAADAAVAESALPAPAARDTRPTTSDEMARAVTVAVDVRKALVGEPGKVALVGGLAEIAKQRADAVGDAADVSTAATFFRGTDEAQASGASVHAVRTKDGSLLVMATYTHTSTLTAKEGHVFQFTNEAFAKALAKQGPLRSAMVRAVCSAVIVIDPGGAATMIGSSCHDIV